MRLPREFYARPTLDVLRDLIGKVLVHDSRGARASGIIVEAEAYIGESDPACHAACGPTTRNAPLYGPPGLAYVYFNYGIHHLVNAVTECDGHPAAVLIRALEPLEGIDVMRRRRLRARKASGAARRHAIAVGDLCRGPGNLTVAMAIDLRQNWSDLTSSGRLTSRGPTSDLWIDDRGIVPPSLDWSPRIGIRVGTEQLWRCSWADHPSVSGPRAGASGRRSPATSGSRSAR